MSEHTHRAHLRCAGKQKQSVSYILFNRKGTHAQHDALNYAQRARHIRFLTPQTPPGPPSAQRTALPRAWSRAHCCPTYCLLAHYITSTARAGMGAGAFCAAAPSTYTPALPCP